MTVSMQLAFVQFQQPRARIEQSLQMPFLLFKIHPKHVGTTALHCSFRPPGQSRLSTVSSLTYTDVRRG